MVSEKKNWGFTLIEILLVVIILGILGTFVLGQFGGMRDSARKAALSDQLHTIRAQIQLYTLQNRDARPPISGADWTPLLVQGTVNGKAVGPYLPSIPRN